MTIIKCSFRSNNSGLESLNEKRIKTIEIVKLSNNEKRIFDDNQIKRFVNDFNKSKSRGLMKFIPQYKIIIIDNKNKIRTLRVHKNTIKENNDLSFKLGNKDYFDSLWTNCKLKETIYSIYIPVQFIDGELIKNKELLTVRHKEAIKQVFNFYNEKWKEQNDTLYIDSEIDEDLIGNYTTKANDANWLKTHIK